MIQERICQQCDKHFEGGPRAWYCPNCRLDRRRQRDMLFHRKKRNSPYEIRELGSVDYCLNCGNAYTVNSGLQKFCERCSTIHNLDYDRVRNMENYKQNKDIINPRRNLRRRKIKGNVII